MGYTFYNISNISCCLTLTNALLIQDIFRKYDEKYYTVYLFSLFLLPYIFSAGVKQFPYTFDTPEEKKKNYNWLVDLSFSFFSTGFKTAKEKKIIKDIKHELITHPYLFVLLQDFLQLCEPVLFLNKNQTSEKENKNFLAWISNQNREEIEKLHNDAYNPHSPTFSKQELFYLDHIFPNDILPKYLFNDMNSFLITKTILSEVYDKNEIITLAKAIKDEKDDTNVTDLISYLTHQEHFKQGFFKGAKKYTKEFFYESDLNNQFEEDIEEIMSEIGRTNDE